MRNVNIRMFFIERNVSSYFGPSSIFRETCTKDCITVGYRSIVSGGKINTITAIVDLSQFNNSCLNSTAST